MLLLAGLASALCSVSQEEREGRVWVVVEALGGDIDCRIVTLDSSRPVEVEARWVTADTRRHRLRGDALHPTPGGGMQIGVPGMAEGDRIELVVDAPGGDLTIVVGELAPAPPRGVWIEEVWTFQLDARHPGWGFADPRKGRTEVRTHVKVMADVGPQRILLPPGAVVSDGAGLEVLPGAVLAPAGTDAVIRSVVPGARPSGRREIGPGSFGIECPACVDLVFLSDPPAVPGATRVDAPAGGTARWRVSATADGDVVIPDPATYLAGLDWRFARVSLPEPAVPVRLKGLREKRLMLEALYAEVQTLTQAHLPGHDPLAPRHLNRAWRSGWATPVERGLILHRMLGQEKIPVEWILTGPDADPLTLTGYDHLLLRAQVDGAWLWLDPSCATCVPGEVAVRRMGQPALGSVDRIPRAPGRLTVTVRPGEARTEVDVVATGAAARWLREESRSRPTALPALLGLPAGTAFRADPVGLEQGDLSLQLSATAAPGALFPEGTPWEGGFTLQTLSEEPPPTSPDRGPP